MSRVNVIALLVFGSLLVWVFTLDGETTQGIQKKVLGIFSPFQRAGTDIGESVREIGDTRPLDPRQLLGENEMLRREVSELRIYRDEQVKLREEWNEVTRLLELKEESHLSLISARVIGRDPSLFSPKLTINKGDHSGIAVESPVLNDRGLIGKTNVVGKSESTVLLLTDEQCQVSARVEGTNERGIVKGIRGTSSGAPLLKLMYLSKDARIQPGAKVFTSGEGGLFPAGIAIGEVKDFRILVDGYSEATVIPAVDFSSLKFLFIIERKLLDESNKNTKREEKP
ncbi:MAG: rod shape-determining protein MreC [Verrucomicrobia bacterium]|nr:rod shape-determining protein MreC [Verrucomicrobiota bacterium]